ncbi:MAG: regulatory protein RecX [Dehalococcoidia bacterium]|nr:regulatory protein RecX [Dehalococcoidia bacterium]
MSPTVTAIVRKAQGVVAVTTDGGDHPSLLPLEAVILHRLHEGSELTLAAWQEICAEGTLLLATRRGLELLAHKQRTERDIRAALAFDFQPADIDRALKRLLGLGFLDDRAWSERYLGGQRAQTRGRSLLRGVLRARGVADEVATQALDGRDELMAATEAARRRAPSLRSIADVERRRRRLYDFLRRRGFADDVCRRAVESALADSET